MTTAESIARMAKLREELEELCKKYNEANQAGLAADVRKLDDEMTQRVNEYTSIVRDMCFEDCKAAADPMLKAITMLSYETIAAKDAKKGDMKIPVREIVPALKQIDLLKLDQFCGGIGADKNWSHYAMKLNFLLTAQKCKDLGIDPKSINDSYSMSEIARDLNMGKNPTSNTQLLKTLQKVVSAMIGDAYKATSHDVQYLMSIYTKKNKAALTVTCANHKYLRQYLAEICHRIVTNKAYSVEYKKIKGATGGSPKDQKPADNADNQGQTDVTEKAAA